MKLSEVIELLTDVKTELEHNDYEDKDPKVLIMHQENYPIILEFDGVCTQREIEDQSSIDDGEKREEESLRSEKQAVFLVGGSSPSNRNPYGDRIAWSIAKGY